jgi:hypothetical protein
MPLTRRQAIRQFLYVSAGVVLIPSCMEDRSKSSILLRNLTITADQEKLLAELAETIIPKTSTPGAKDLSAHLFALKMIDDCRSKEDQDTFLEGLRAFEKTAGRNFAQASLQERAKILEPLDKDKESKEPAALFYRTMKRLTIQAYTSSEYFLTKVQVYELVPGRYHGCVPVKAS